MTERSTTETARHVRELKDDERDAIAGGVIAIIRPEYKPGGMDRIISLLPYIEQK